MADIGTVDVNQNYHQRQELTVHQIKLFKGLESDLGEVERQVNAWLAVSNARIINIFGNMSPQSCPAEDKNTMIAKGSFVPSDILLVVHYVQ